MARTRRLVPPPKYQARRHAAKRIKREGVIPDNSTAALSFQRARIHSFIGSTRCEIGQEKYAAKHCNGSHKPVTVLLSNCWRNWLGQPWQSGSSYLPAGYYAAGASQLGNGQGMAHVGQGSPGISLSNLGPARDGYARTRSVGPSPPGSPYINAIPSSSTLNLSQAPGDQRAPSAYLDDLFDSEGSPPMAQHRRAPSGPRNSARF